MINLRNNCKAKWVGISDSWVISGVREKAKATDICINDMKYRPWDQSRENKNAHGFST